MPEKNIDLNEIKKEALQLTLKDGIMEFFMGIMISLIGLVLNNPVFTSFIALVLIFGPKVMENLKEKDVYPRTGYIKLREENEEKNMKKIAIVTSIIVLFSLLVVILIMDNISEAVSWWKTAPLLLGLIIFAPCYDLAIKSGQKRYYIYGIVSVVLAITTMSFNYNTPEHGILIYTSILGFSFILLGYLKFHYFKKNNPILEEEPDDDSLDEEKSNE